MVDAWIFLCKFQFVGADCIHRSNDFADVIMPVLFYTKVWNSSYCYACDQRK